MKNQIIIVVVLILSSLGLTAKNTVLINEANGKPLVGVQVYKYNYPIRFSNRYGIFESGDSDEEKVHLTYNYIKIYESKKVITNGMDTIFIEFPFWALDYYDRPSLSINVVDEKNNPIESALISLSNFVEAGLTDDKGKYSIEYILPEKIRISAWPDGYYRTDTIIYLKRNEEKNLVITCRKHEVFEPSYIPASTNGIEFEIYNDEGFAVGASVYLKKLDIGNFVNRDGKVRFDSLDEGRYLAEIKSVGNRDILKIIDVKSGFLTKQKVKFYWFSSDIEDIQVIGTYNSNRGVYVESTLKNQIKRNVWDLYSDEVLTAGGDLIGMYPNPMISPNKSNQFTGGFGSAGTSYDDDALAPPSSSSSTIQAGSLTAGEVNDFRKWDMWADIAKDELSHHVGTWGIEPTKRYTVQLTSLDNKPVSDAVVNLISQTGETIWSARSDNTGKAELWADAFKANNDDESGLSVEVIYKGKRQIKNNISDFKNGINFIKVNEYCSHSQNVDIVFAMDATGSMGDEIEYLKTELLDIIERLQKAQDDKNLRIGSIFYRDFDYPFNELIATHDLTNDFSSLNKFINSQEAISGNSTAEAVEVALSSAVNEFTWSEDAVARIMFLILDAPPHEDPQTLSRFRELTARASAMGIRIIPLTASGIDKSSEYLMRSLALLTNGTYLFLTDDSGIGGSHIKPTTDSYDVEMMNEMIVRIINQFIDTPTCGENDDLYAKDIDDNIYNDKEQKDSDISDFIKIFPNPTDGPLTLELEEKFDQIFVVDMNGKILFQLEPNGTRLQINLSEYPTGAYFLKYSYKGAWGSSQIRLMR